jgi:metal-responsive CopG/Arc/MetJ family transcriptional regulator
MEAEGVTCMKVVSFKIEEDLLELLEEYSKKRNTTKSEIIRRALRSYIMRNSETPFETRRIRIVT